MPGVPCKPEAADGDEEMHQTRDKRSMISHEGGHETVAREAKKHRLRSVALNNLDTNVTGHDEIQYGKWEQFYDELTGQ